MPHRRGDIVSGMALRRLVEKITPKSVAELDRAKLDQFRIDQDAHALDAVGDRQRVAVAGEVRSVRIVPRAGAPALEVLVTDGRGAVTAVFLGRRKIIGVSPGRRLLLNGLTVKDRNRMLIYNPVYELR